MMYDFNVLVLEVWEEFVKKNTTKNQAVTAMKPLLTVAIEQSFRKVKG